MAPDADAGVAPAVTGGPAGSAAVVCKRLLSVRLRPAPVRSSSRVVAGGPVGIAGTDEEVVANPI